MASSALSSAAGAIGGALGQIGKTAADMLKNMKLKNQPPQDGKKNYLITIETPDISGAGAVGVFFLKLKGNKGTSEEFIISTTGFSDGSKKVILKRL